MTSIFDEIENVVRYPVPESELGFMSSKIATQFVAGSQAGVRLGPVLDAGKLNFMLIEVQPEATFGPWRAKAQLILGHCIKGPTAISRGINVGVGEGQVTKCIQEMSFQVPPGELFGIYNASSEVAIIALVESGRVSDS